MPIIQTIDSFSAFQDAFYAANRSTQFSYEALKVLYHHIEDCYHDTNYELDVIGLCCDYSELTEKELIEEYGEKDESIEDVLSRIEDRTLCLQCGNGNYLLQVF